MAIKRPIADIQADITRWKLKLTAAEETLDAINATANEKNHFDDNEGSQSNTKRKILDQMDYIDRIDAKLKELNAELIGKNTRITHVNRRNIGGGGIHI